MTAQINFRTIVTNGRLYIRRADVAAVLRDLAAGEETDTRERIERLATMIESLHGPKEKEGE